MKQSNDTSSKRDTLNSTPMCIEIHISHGYYPVIYFLFAIAGAFGLSAQFTQVDESYYSFMQLVYLSVKNSGLSPFLWVVVLSVAIFIEEEIRLNRRERAAIIILAIIEAFIITIGRAFNVLDIGFGSYGTLDTLFKSSARLAFSILIFLGLLIACYAIIKLVYVIVSRKLRVNLIGETPKHALFLNRNFCLHTTYVMALLLVLWLPYVFLYFPGIIYIDGAMELRQFFGADAYSTHHPLTPTLLMGSVIALGRLFGSDTLGVFFYTILQTLTLAYTCSRIVSTTAQYKHGLIIAQAAILAFGLLPVWPFCAITIKKDCFFCCSFVLLLLNAFRYLQFINATLPDELSNNSELPQRNAILARIFLFSLVVSLFRNDGIIISSFIVICLLVATIKVRRPFNKPARPKLTNNHSGYLKQTEGKISTSKLAPMVLVMALFLSCYFVGYKMVLVNAFNAEEGSIGEALTIPIQQTARYYIEYPEGVTEEIDNGVSRVLDTAGLTADVYYPMISDYIKNDYFKAGCSLDDLLAFTKSYALMGLSRPDLFFSALIDQTIGWWDVELNGDPDHVISGMGIYQNMPATQQYSSVIDVEMPFWGSEIQTIHTSLVDCVAYIPLVGMFVYPAIYFNLIIALIVYSWAARKRGPLYILLPLLLYMCICIASPVNGLTRYAVPIMTSIPFILAWIFEPDNNNRQSVHREDINEPSLSNQSKFCPRESAGRLKPARSKSMKHLVGHHVRTCDTNS